MKFYKMQASGNDFILIQATGRNPQAAGLNYKKFAKMYCKRKFGIGADGLLVIEPSKKYDFKMRIFNADGSEAEMCGNGARCSALWAYQNLLKGRRNMSFEAKAGIINAQTGEAENVKIRLSEPVRIKSGLSLKILGRNIKVDYIDTGVPHAVIFVEGIDKIDVDKIGRAVRFHKKFQPKGVNADFVEVEKRDFISIRTYERGVEAETLACGTGVAAAAVIAGDRVRRTEDRNQMTDSRKQKTENKFRIKVLTKSGDILKVYFQKEEGNIRDVWLEGKASFVFEGILKSIDKY